MPAESRNGPSGSLVHLRARPDTLYASHSRTVLATRTDGFVDGEPEKGLFVLQTRMLSRYRTGLQRGRSTVPPGGPTEGRASGSGQTSEERK